MSAEGSSTQEESQHSTEETKSTGGSDSRQDSRQTRPAQEVPDVTLDVPTLNLEEAHLQVENLRARISLQAELADMVSVNIGVDAFLEKVELDLKGLEAQALLKANLENVREILIRTLESLDDNPRLLDNLAQLTGGSGNKLEGVAGDVAGGRDEEEPGGKTGGESAGEIEATDAARSKAEALGVDLDQVEGTGSGGRVIVRDVQRAARRA